MAPLTAAQVADCVIVERSSASLSIISVLVMFITFAKFPRIRTPSNTLLVLASFANLAANVAALMGGSGLNRPDGPLCQIQGLLLEWFMQADPLWGACMAFNVYCVIFYRWGTEKLKKVFKYYFVLCYGVPFIPATFCLFYKTKENGRIYGNATLWCWIDNSWQTVRIYSYYGPIWCYILVTFLIYIRVGFEVSRKRSALKAFESGPNAYVNYGTQFENRSGINKCNLWIDNQSSTPSSSSSALLKPFTGTRTTEVEVTISHNSITFPEPCHTRTSLIQQPGNFVHISTNVPSPGKPSYFSGLREIFLTIRRRLTRMDKVKLAYSRCAILFATSILITWVPSSANRVYSLVYPSAPSYGLNVAASAVLPLQGFWNAMIFFWTSNRLIRAEYQQWRLSKIALTPKHNSSDVENFHMPELQPRTKVGSDGGTRPEDTDSAKTFSDDEEGDGNFGGIVQPRSFMASPRPSHRSAWV